MKRTIRNVVAAVAICLIFLSCDALLEFAVGQAGGVVTGSGTKMYPFKLTLGTPRDSSVSADYDSETWFSFEVTSAGSYDVLMSNVSGIYSYSSYMLELFQGEKAINDSYNLSLINESLTAGEYKVCISNNSSSEITFTILVQAHTPTSDGTSASPVALTVGVP